MTEPLRMGYAKLFLGAKTFAVFFLELLRQAHPGNFLKNRELYRHKAIALNALSFFSKSNLKQSTFRQVLVDGMWDNPNYWFRFALVRRALGLHLAEETGLLGAYSRTSVKQSFLNFGITRLIDFEALTKGFNHHLKQAEKLLCSCQTPEDFLNLKMPNDFPMSFVFDGVLKRQRSATVNLKDPKLKSYLAEALAHIEAADDIFKSASYDLVLLSHALDYTYSSIAWSAIKRKIPVLVLYGDYGTARFLFLKEARDLFAYPGRPTAIEIDSMSPTTKEKLREAGASQILARLSGQTDDVGSVYAYQMRREMASKSVIAERYGWDLSKPIIGVYNSNWFDYPHAGGLHYFRDFLDWIERTLEVAKSNNSVNWLFKAHPCDDWYARINGTRLEDLVMAAQMPHIQIADKAWNGQSLIESLNGIVTCHGTVGIEASALNKPVLVSYSGWYGHAGFVIDPGDREGYLKELQRDWWNDVDSTERKYFSELFAGWVFCVPDWHGNYILQDDSKQAQIYNGIPCFLVSNKDAIEMELIEIRDWYASKHPYFHVFKMTRAKGFQSCQQVST